MEFLVAKFSMLLQANSIQNSRVHIENLPPSLPPSIPSEKEIDVFLEKDSEVEPIELDKCIPIEELMRLRAKSAPVSPLVPIEGGRELRKKRRRSIQRVRFEIDEDKKTIKPLFKTEADVDQLVDDIVKNVPELLVDSDSGDESEKPQSSTKPNEKLKTSSDKDKMVEEPFISEKDQLKQIEKAFEDWGITKEMRKSKLKFQQLEVLEGNLREK
ncbi:hypothetical protein BDR26DRAFT_893232 [Obelidium mucronatum]|nr:hypothetical protein BDR26DRAFT_893232 [Obelidium mucronatum]